MLQPGDNRPTVILDLYVWLRHFTFEPAARDFERSMKLLSGTNPISQHTPRFIDPQERIKKLPTSPKDIVLSADVSQGSIEALDTFLCSMDHLQIVKSEQPIPSQGRRANGRSVRYCYTCVDKWKKKAD